MKEKMTVTARFSKGITISKDYQSVKYEIGVEIPVEVHTGMTNRELEMRMRDAIESMEEFVNKELAKRRNKSLHALEE